jgi:hypothetical protein
MLYIGFMVWAISRAYWIVVPFLALFAIGFLFTGLSSQLESRRRKVKITPAPLSLNAASKGNVIGIEPDRNVYDDLIPAE